VFPLITEAIKGVKVSVGEPYFNQMAIPCGLLMVFLMGVGPALPWGRANAQVVMRSFGIPLGAGLLVALAAFQSGLRDFAPLAAFSLCGFAGFVTLREMFGPVLERMKKRKENFGTALKMSVSATRRRFGGYVVHLAVIAIVAAIAGNKTYKISTEASLQPGESFNLGEYTFVFNKTEAKDYSQKFSVMAQIDAFHRDEPAGSFAPALNYYKSQREPIGTPDVQTKGQTDVYLSLLSFEKDGSRVVVKAYLMPMVPWLWWSIPIIMLGSLISLWPRRRRQALVAPGGAEVT
ncbi:MAG: heme lyase CcmF/NrfE family subunit, partial [Deltaproteobacteria bacterium]|nr:heme lyase CcmF/NrfE family subunit [Deltaproteobacteria bacterium]